MDQQKNSGEPSGGGNGETISGTVQGINVSVNTSQLSSHYCNVSTVNSTREEVVLSFGIHQNWDRTRNDPAVALLHRVIVSPQHARRLHALLSEQIERHEKRYGVINV